jgi:hypothetical protein
MEVYLTVDSIGPSSNTPLSAARTMNTGRILPDDCVTPRIIHVSCYTSVWKSPTPYSQNTHGPWTAAQIPSKNRDGRKFNHKLPGDMIGLFSRGIPLLPPPRPCYVNHPNYPCVDRPAIHISYFKCRHSTVNGAYIEPGSESCDREA